MTTPAGPGQETERFGRPVRQFPVAVSAGAMALAWARQENAPAGATVLVDREISPLGRHGRLWTASPEATLTCAVVLRPQLPAEQGDVSWLLAALAAAEGAAAVTDKTFATWWPDAVIDPETKEAIASIKAEVQLGPGQVRIAVATVRLDLAQLGLDATRRDDLLEPVLRSFDTHTESLVDGAAAVAAAYEGRCSLIGSRVKIALLPKGETRGVASGIDRQARLELRSPTGMVERVGIDQLRSLEVV